MINSGGSTSDSKFTNSNKLVHYLDLSNFKLLPCSIKMQHNHKQCQFFHYFKDRKRQGDYYSTDLCDYIEKDMDCPMGDKCLKSHNRVEQLYRPLKYKARFCSFFPNNIGKCEYGDFCSFAHSEQEISIDLIHLYDYDEDFYLFHYKTVMCPFNQSKHDKGLCVYSHNWQDYRRKPNEYNYDPFPCPNWKTTDFVATYEAGCKMDKNCDKCHGWKEYDFHPFNWRTKACPNGANCPKKKECSYYHSLTEKREVDQTVQNRIFRFIPRNRITSNNLKKNIYEGLSYCQNDQDSFVSNGSITNSAKESMTFSWPKNPMFDQQNWMSNNGGSEKKSPQKQKLDNNYDYNIWSQNHPPPRESNGNSNKPPNMEKMQSVNSSSANYFSRNFSLVNKNQNYGNRNNNEEENFMNKSVFRPTSNQNQMSFSNPIQFKNNQTFNPNYANQLQEQFYNITQFVQESSYDPSKKNSTSEKKNSFEENALDDEKLLKMTNQIEKMNIVPNCE